MILLFFNQGVLAPIIRTLTTHAAVQKAPPADPIGSDDMLARLKSLVPGGWFASALAPVRDAVFGGLADSLAKAHALLFVVKQQTRIATAYGWFLDLIAWDFFGSRFLRLKSETDDSWRTRIIKEILRPRQTRAAIAQALFDLTGRQPKIFEFWNPYDCGGYDIGTLAYDTAGCYGDLSLNNQIFVTAYRPAGEGVPYVSGYDSGASGYDVGDNEYVDLSWITAPVTDADIYAAVAGTVAAGVTGWTAIQS